MSDWLKDKPKERVRQNFIHLLHHQYGYAYAQMDQEQRTQSGTRSPRIDIAVWATVEAAAQIPRPVPVLVVECKAEKVDIHARDYFQGESYARAVGDPCEFLVMHNQRQTSFFRLTRGLPGGLTPVTDLPRAEDWGGAQKLQKIREAQRAFKRKEFQDLLFECHTILRDVQKANPLDAFDTISKILFTKMYVERTGTHGTFTTEFLDQRANSRLSGEKLVHEALFESTRQYYQTDDLFAAGEKLNVAESTFRRIVEKLQKFNLSATGDDVKGLAFEQFLGQTFRGNLGQYFTPRPVVEFMVGLLNPQEGDLVCDPTAGSGGFLINAFENKAMPADLTPLPDLQVQAGDVLIGRANILRLVGACAIVRETPARLMLCDKIFRVVFEENSPIDPEYLVEVLKTPALRLQIETAATGTSPTMKNISKAALMDLLLPLPASQEVQRELVYALRADRAAAHELRREAAMLRTAADGAFAGAVFGGGGVKKPRLRGVRPGC